MNSAMMNKRQPSLLSILQPPRYETNELRARVTRTVLQPEIDKFEQLHGIDVPGNDLGERPNAR